MLRVGLTGGIGSGKSTVARRLAGHGAVVIDADRIAREVVEPGSAGLAELVAAFGADILTGSGELDRPALAKRAFADDASRLRLNGVLHPRIAARTLDLMAAAPHDSVVVHDVPLLVENDLAPNYHLVLVVDAPVDTRVARLLDRGLAEDDARARIAAQATDEARRAVADVWLDNGGTQDAIQATVDALWAERLVPFEVNVRTGSSPERGKPTIVPPDPTWPEQAARLVARLGRLTGGLRVDHIGSTSVPGLSAKDVIDLQVTVPDDPTAITTALADAGFPHYPGLTDTPHPPHTDPAEWRKEVHVSADPGRPANVHVRRGGSPGWRYALLVPAWLRADPDARDEYDRLKRDLAPGSATVGDYAEAKSPWFASALPRADRWAADTGWRP